MNSFHSASTTSFRSPTIVVLIILLSSASSTLAAQTSSRADDVAAVTSALTELSRREEQGSLNDVYDLMAPDARLLLPRQAMVNWFDSGDTPVAVDDPEVTEVTFEDWTWETTGKTYTDVAHVAYTQGVALNGEESSRDLDRYFVHDGQRWRWFPAIDADKVSMLISDLDTNVDFQSDSIRNAYQRIDTFWAEAFDEAGLTYISPSDIVAVDSEPYDTGCGVERDIDKAAIYYCTLDDTIYYSPRFRQYVVSGAGSYGWDNIIAHEWGHHIQDQVGIEASRHPELDGGYYVIEMELQADCLAGVYAQDAEARGVIDKGDIDDAESITGDSGDFPDTTFDDEHAHGTGEQRVQSFLTGFDDGFIGCNIDLASIANQN